MKAIKVIGGLLIIVFVYLLLSGDLKKSSDNQEPVKTVSLLKIKDLDFNSTPDQVIDILGSPNKTNSKSVIKKEVIKNKPIGQENVLVDINLGGVNADRCLSYNTNQEDTWMLCFKNNQLVSKSRLAQLGRPGNL
jgi:hypothetical protein